jgi:CheY-like chemotaxis protein
VADAAARGKPLALVVDDHAENRAMLAKIVKREGFEVIEGADGEEAVALAADRSPDLILLDISMPKKSGLEALEEIREHDRDVPVVIVSAVDQPEASQEALNLGAVNFVRKPFDPQEIRFVVGRIRGALEEEADVIPTLRLLRERRTVLELGNDVPLLSQVTAFLGRELRLHYPRHEVPVTEIKLALYEALANSIEHGNLEIDYDAKTKAMETEGGIIGLIERRRADPRYADRTVLVQVDYEPHRVLYRIKDSGPGFPHGDKAHSKRLGDTTALHGRGILLIRHYMSSVQWNEAGNEIQMTLDLVEKSSDGKRAPKK